MKPNSLFEVSWEVCNKVGGIYTVISTKVPAMIKEVGDNYFLIGPDILKDNEGDQGEFIQDDSLYIAWRQQAAAEGLNVRVGRWNLPGKPKVILIDFYSFISQKDEIFAKLWEDFKLDSLSGQWDYIEPALFGYAAGRLIESFVNFNLGFQENVVAQFHEWMTGAGVLYLNSSAPHIATVFTTHATVLGRALAANNKQLYKNLEQFNPNQIAREFNIVSKHSLESLSGQAADAFTTVSTITARECKYFLGKEVDRVTPNGFEDSFVPQGEMFGRKREEARRLLLRSAGALYGKKFDDQAFLVAISGRYEFKNKGIDIFIRSLAQLKERKKEQREVVAFILIPADHAGPCTGLQEVMEGKKERYDGDPLLTHDLRWREHDAILQLLKEEGLDKPEDSGVHVVFVPSYLNGDDGIYNLPYYDLLVGFDLTAFPSYYEPWGYTPLESLAFHVPTVTTTLAGFGAWVKEYYEVKDQGIVVLERNDDNDDEVTSRLAAAMEQYVSFPADRMEKARKEAHAVSRIALWKNLVKHYLEAYRKAVEEVNLRFRSLDLATQTKEAPFVVPPKMLSTPQWKPLFIESRVPSRLKVLEELAGNLWWSWYDDAAELWQAVDENLWEETGHNPVMLLERVDYKRLLSLSRSKKFLAHLDNVVSEFRKYMDEKPDRSLPHVAYFSMEFGLHSTLKIYSGGLGVLAGDYLKEASDENRPMTGIGLLYRYGYFKQVLSSSGEQQEVYEAEQFSHLPVMPVKDEAGNWLSVQVAFPGRVVTAKIWEAKVGRVSLYLLDTDLEENQDRDRQITHHLYGGDRENRLKQELLLGVGGIRALRVMGIQPDIYHSNEGHSAFIGLERINCLIHEYNLSFAEAREVVRGSTLFTTHTPVPAGHDLFDENLLRTYLAHYPDRLKISWDELMNLGRKTPGDKNEKFNMSFLAANLSSEINGVSRLHGEVSRELFKDLWPGFLKEELHIGYVTNGVHYDTWASAGWKDFLMEKTDSEGSVNPSREETWKKIEHIPARDLWAFKREVKKEMIRYIRERFTKNGTRRHESPRKIIEINRRLREDALTIGFARRFASYKRGTLLFRDTERLKKLVSDEERPVQFLFAGKAHPQDTEGKKLISEIYRISRMPEFKGKILFLEDYDMELASHLVQGVDIWLNTPTRPLEASGTSGEKAVMNGTLHFSVLDGWWVEGYVPGAGWALPQERTYQNQDLQDEMDVEMIYSILENEIIPLYYDRNKEEVAEGWIRMIKKNLLQVAPNFTMYRMMQDYYDRYYLKMFERSKLLRKSRFEQARLLALWKYQVYSKMEKIRVLSSEFSGDGEYRVGEEYTGSIVLDLDEILPEWIQVELVVTDRDKSGNTVLVFKQPFDLAGQEGSEARYTIRVEPTKPGYFFYDVRIVPTHPLLPHPQDVNMVMWI